MAHFIKLRYDDGDPWYLNLDAIVEVDVDCRTVSLVDGDEVKFDDDVLDAEWRLVLKYISENEFV